MNNKMIAGAALCVAVIAVALMMAMGGAFDNSSDDKSNSGSTTNNGSSSGDDNNNGSSSGDDNNNGSSSGDDNNNGSSSGDDNNDSGNTVIDLSECEITITEGTVEYTTSASNGETIVTFTNATSDVECTITGTLTGSIVIEIDESYEFKLTLSNATITSSYEAPITVTSADKFTLAAKNGTTNTITDNRDEVTDDSAISSAVYADCDIDVQGRGTLTVYSKNNNGIHSKDDLKVKNLTLNVECSDNALKGNDSVTIESGTIVLKSREGDGIKTTNYELKTKTDGTTKQEGIVTLNTDEGDLTLTIYAYADGIDAAYNVVTNETEGTLTLNIYAGTYSGYSSGTSTTSLSSLAAGPGGNSGTTPGGNSNGGMPGGNNGTTPGGNSNGGMPSGDNDGNSNSTSYSCKGIKGDYGVTITGGTITIKSSDDGIHSGGDIEVSGGNITITTGDDGIHSDASLKVSAGTIDILECYEGLEGNTVTISGGNVSIVSSDDGINSTGTSGTGITISGGTLYVNAGGDGLDSNSQTSKQGVVITGGDSVVISNNGSDSCIDTENGYTYTGGRFVGLNRSDSMPNQEATNCQSSNKSSSNVSLSSGQYLTVSVGGTTVAAVKMPVSISSAFVVYLGSSSASFSTASSYSGTDSNGVYWS